MAAAFAIGIAASVWADRRDPDAAAKREERGQRTSRSAGEGSAGGEPVESGEPEASARRPERRALAGAQAQQRNGVGGAGERVGDDAAVGGDMAATARPSANGHQDVAGARGSALVEGGEAGEGAAVGGAGGAELEVEEVMGSMVSVRVRSRPATLFGQRPVSSTA